MRKAQVMLQCTIGLLILVGYCSRTNAQVGTCSGCLDATFGNGTGIVVTTVGTSPAVRGIALETVTQNGVPVQTIVVAASTEVNGSSFFAAARYNMDGSPDTTFNGNGILITNVGGYVQGLAVQSDQKILLVGQGGVIVVRLNTDGSMDTSFGSGGVVNIASSKKTSLSANAIQVQSDGKIVVAGSSSATPTVWRFTTSGTLDNSFGSGGAAPIAIASGMAPRALALQTISGSAGQTIVVGGFTSLTVKGKSHDEFALARLTSSGQMDTSFGIEGVVTHSVSNFNNLIFGLAIDSSNDIVAAGQADLTGTTGGIHVAVARYNLNGSADATFGTGGYTTFSELPNDSYGNAVAVQSNDQPVVAGYSTSSAGLSEMAVARLTTAGALDGNFGTGGYVTVDFSSDGYNKGYGYGVLVQPDGKIVVGGDPAVGPSTTAFGLARYWP